MQTTTTTQRPSNLTRNIAIVVVILVVGSVIGYYAFNASMQPDIQATNLVVGSATTDPQTTTFQDQGRVANSGSFSYTPSVDGVVYLVFDNTFSIISSKSVGVTYAAAGSTQSQSMSVPAGDIQTVQVPLNSGQSISGTFTVSGGSGNDIDFSIQQYTCSQTVPFSVTLVNSGKASGYVILTMQNNGSPTFSSKYFVAQGQQLPVSGQATIWGTSTCPAATTLTPVLSQQQKG